ncbi:MAG: fibronectin type III domain-containing protein [Acidimicrobiales bacterium]
MRVLRLIVLSFAVAVGGLGLFALPVAAEIDPTNQTWWGVDGTVTGTTTDLIDNDVWAIEQIGDRVYVGGKFSRIAHETDRFDQPFIAAFDAATGIWISSWTPQFDGPVYALQRSADGSRLFVGGEFETVDGANVKGLVALDPATGRVDWNWRTRVSGGSPAVVRALDLEGDQLYVGGSFDYLGVNGVRVATDGVGRVSASTGVIDTTWLPTMVGGTTWDLAPSKTSDAIYIVGSFTSVDGQAGTQHVARLDDTGHVLGSWRYVLNHDYPEWAQVVETTPQGLVFIGGSQHILNAYTETDMALQWSHTTNPAGGDYQAAEYDPATGRVYASCHCFNQHWSRNDGGVNTLFRGQPMNWTGTVTDIDWVIAYDGATGAKVDTFVPDFSGQAGPWALHTSPNGCLWVGGGISATNGVSQRSLTKICDLAVLDSVRPSTPGSPTAANATSSTVDLTWNPSTDNVGVTGYEVYDNLSGQVIATSPTNSVTVTGLAAGTYELYVKAQDADGNRSWRSGIRSVVLTGDDITRPSTPRGFNIASSDATTISFVWLPSTDNVGVVGYEILDVATGAVVATSATTEVTMPLTPGVTVAVRAYDAAGNRSWRSNTQTM